MADQYICRECGRIIRGAKYKDKNWTLYCSLKKLRLCPECARG